MSSYVMFRGRRACTCLAKWLPVYEAELLRRGLIKRSIDIYQLIGGAVQSAGTHSKGGAADLAQWQWACLQVARWMGADADWHRGPPSFIHHAHLVLRGCPHNTPARYQITAVDANYNGLGYMGRGGRDNGPRPLSHRTWKQGIAWAKAKQKPTTPEGLFGMSNRRILHRRNVIHLKKGVNRIIPLTDKYNGGSSLMWHPSSDINATSDFYLAGVTNGSSVMARYVIVKGKSNNVIASLPITELGGTTGKDHDQMTQNLSLRKGERLRVQLTSWQDGVEVRYARHFARWV